MLREQREAVSLIARRKIHTNEKDVGSDNKKKKHGLLHALESHVMVLAQTVFATEQSSPGVFNVAVKRKIR